METSMKYESTGLMTAVKIVEVNVDAAGQVFLVTKERLEIEADSEFVRVHRPIPGGYLVTLDTDEVSWCPGQFFESVFEEVMDE